MTAGQAPQTAAPVRHRPRIARRPSITGSRIYWLVCTCGTTGREWFARGPAVEELERHIATLPRVPAGQECRDSKSHDRRDWEPCSLCAGQLALFDL
ncbi:hypothetical protein [Planomonospora sp. ID82291]|uniref:hypothetical protein n=1 Tax=Planomonospora sp. ID82291 TaxID=2738136 RepID=UPI0018C3CA3C|nr:hypothetical protein [Planomonospora sp. ID82291]MBG0819091.1 hypothetical protein [Planomonospora sp. ID82291]